MTKTNTRLVSLDIFRGLTVAFMIIVNNPGSWSYVYPPLRHSEWHGCTPTDLVFPFFLFIVGVSTWYSLKKYGHDITWASIFRIVRRTLAIFAVGLLLGIFPYFISRDYSSLRIMGVLQRIALAYGLGAMICLVVKREYLWIVVAVLLILYWGLMALLGGPDPYSLQGNFALKFDTAILGEKHLYKGFGIPFDPEGLFSTLPAIGTVIIGFFAGEILGRAEKWGKTFLTLILIGAGLIGLGLLWNMAFPINKPLWTSSYVLYTSGLAMILLSVIYVLADALLIQKWGIPFMVFGTNALFSFFLAGIFTKTILYLIKIPAGADKISLYAWFYQKVCVPVAGNMNGSLMFAIIEMLIIWGFSLILYRKKIFIRL